MDDEPSVDLEAVRRKYREERDKRLDGANRDILLPEFTGPTSRYLVDPYTPRVERAALDDEVDLVIVGAGFSGLLLGRFLRDRGIRRIRLIDTAGDVGGVWYWNRYPGAMCDVESLIYLPLLEELNYTPRDRYAAAAEIFEHARSIARKWDLYDDALFHTAVTALTWQDADRSWRVTTDRDDNIRAQHVVIANGPLSRLKLPDLPGIETFEGRMFHTSRWDYAYTGGGPNSPMPGIADKSVGIVGTGATGLQCVPATAESAGRLYVFQRTPSTVAIRDNRPIEPDWVAAQAPGWQEERQLNFTKVLAGIPVDDDLVSDGWTDLYTHLTFDPAFAGLPPSESAHARELADFRQIERLRQRITDTVTDARTAEALKPYYAYLCKRPGFHDGYLKAFNRPNVELVDTQGKGLESVFPGGVVVEGKKYNLDCLIFATGFESETSGKLRTGFEIYGRGGLSLSEKWKDGMITLHGIMSAQFPNFFLMPYVNAQSTVTSNFMHTMTKNAEHVAYIIGETQARAARVVEVTESAERDWLEVILTRRVDKSAFLAACTPGRQNYEGSPDGRLRQNTNFGGTPIEMYGILADWRSEGSLAGLTLNE